MVVEADDTSDLPYSIFVLPEVNELSLTDIIGVTVRVMEAMHLLSEIHPPTSGNLDCFAVRQPHEPKREAHPST